MNLRILEYIVAVADTKHFSRAAQKCHVSQPTLSMQIKKFEDMLGVQIFERDNKTVMLTDIGITLVEQARKVNVASDELRQIANTAKNPFEGTLKIGIIPTLAPFLLPKFVPTLTKKFPKLILYLKELRTAELLEQVHNGNLDMVIISLPISDRQLTTRSLFHEQFYLAVPSNHRLANKKKVSIKDIAKEKMLLLEEGHCLREQALAVCHKNRGFNTHDFQATSLETLRQMVIARVGITLMPELACHHHDHHIAYIPFVEPKPSREIGLAWRNTSGREALFEAICKLV